MLSGNPASDLAEALLELAADAVRRTAAGQTVLMPDLNQLPADLRAAGACFVTLKKAGRLRGCIGNLQATDALAFALVRNATASTSRDPRFPPVASDELGLLELDVSVLSAAKLIEVASESELCERLVPDRDGVILSEGKRRATFLPSVWSELPEPAEFLRRLKRKGGWAPDYWSAQMQVYLYHASKYGPVALLG